MKLCTTDNTADRLDELHDVIDLLCSTFCLCRDLPVEGPALSGAQLIFWAVQRDLMTLADTIRDSNAVKSPSEQQASPRQFIMEILSKRLNPPSKHDADTLCKHPVNGVDSTQVASGEVRCVKKPSRPRKRLYATIPYVAKNHRRRVCPSS